MGTPRVVDVLLSIFDMHITEGANRREIASTRVLFTFDRKMGTKEFAFLDADISKDVHGRIKEWLDQNIDEQKIAYGIKSNRIDVQFNRDEFCEG